MASWLRDVVTPLVGLWLIYQESQRPGDTFERWPILVIYAGMVGLPSLTFLDWRKGGTAPPPAVPSPPSAPSLPGTPDSPT